MGLVGLQDYQFAMQVFRRQPLVVQMVPPAHQPVDDFLFNFFRGVPQKRLDLIFVAVLQQKVPADFLFDLFLAEDAGVDLIIVLFGAP